MLPMLASVRIEIQLPFGLSFGLSPTTAIVLAMVAALAVLVLGISVFWLLTRRPAGEHDDMGSFE